MTADESRNMKDISASEYIRTNFHPSDRIAVLVRNGGTGETIQRIATANGSRELPLRNGSSTRMKRGMRHLHRNEHSETRGTHAN